MKKLKLAALLIMAAIPALAIADAPAVSIKNAASEPWALSNTMPVGAAYQLIYENPATHGVQLLVRFPSGYKIPSHYHSQTEVIFMVSGKMQISTGGETSTLKAGSYTVIPAGTSLSLATAGWGSCEFVSSFDGPFDVKGLSKTP